MLWYLCCKLIFGSKLLSLGGFGSITYEYHSINSWWQVEYFVQYFLVYHLGQGSNTSSMQKACTWQYLDSKWEEQNNSRIVTNRVSKVDKWWLIDHQAIFEEEVTFRVKWLGQFVPHNSPVSEYRLENTLYTLSRFLIMADEVTVIINWEVVIIYLRRDVPFWQERLFWHQKNPLPSKYCDVQCELDWALTDVAATAIPSNQLLCYWTLGRNNICGGAGAYPQHRHFQSALLPT